jgi:hypothetical protein
MREFRLIIAGSRDFDDYELLKKKTNHVLSEKVKTHEIKIVSGCASGADNLGERYAVENGYEIEKHPALWSRHGRAAGPIRNGKMAEQSDALIVFWDGKSKGTRNMIHNMGLLGKPIVIIIARKK